MIRLLLFLAPFALATTVSNADETAAPAAGELKVDLAGLADVGRVVPVDGVTSAGQPDAAQFRVFADSAYVAVVDLRTAGEDRGLDEPAVVEALGMEYAPFPVGRSDITIDKARSLFELIGRYDGPVLVHCTSANRVGALFALKKFDETGDPESAVEAGKAAGLTRLEDAVR